MAPLPTGSGRSASRGEPLLSFRAWFPAHIDLRPGDGDSLGRWGDRGTDHGPHSVGKSREIGLRDGRQAAFQVNHVIGVLSASVTRELVDNPVIPKNLKAQFDLDDIAFVSNDHLPEVLEETAAAPREVTEAVHINTEGRSRALRICCLALTGLALVAIFPAGGLSGYDEAALARRRG